MRKEACPTPVLVLLNPAPCTLMPRTSRLLSLLTSALLAGAAIGQVVRLDLGQMVRRTDGAVEGRIIERRVTHLEETKDGPDLFFTTLTVEGRELGTGESRTVEVSFPGGFVDEDTGVWNSEAPSAEDQRLRNHVVVFWKESPDMGGGFAGNALYASHGGLFRVFQDRRGRDVVLGRGEGYAVDFNQRLGDLRARYAPLRAAEDKARKEGRDPAEGER